MDLVLDGNRMSVAVPALCGLFALASTLLKAQYSPPLQIVVLVVNYWGLLLLSWYQKAVLPFVAGTSGGVLITFYFFVITALGDEKGRIDAEKLDFHFYAFIVPLWLGLCNLVKHLLQRQYPDYPWILPFAVLGAFSGNVLLGFATGYLQSNYAGVDLLLYLLTSLCLYVFVIAGIIRGLEHLVRQEVPSAAVAAPESQKTELELQGVSGNVDSTERQSLQSSESVSDRGSLVEDYSNAFEFVLPSRAYWFRVFDSLFMAAFAVGWILTLIYERDFLATNPIVKVFKVNNICVGVDAGPARLAANCLWGVMLLPMALYAVTSYMQMHNFGKDKRLIKVSTALLCLGYILAMCFGLSFGIQPKEEDLTSIYVHTWGFALGMVGYSLMRLAELTTYYNETNRDELSIGYLVLLAVYFVWAMAGALPLIYTLVVDDFAVEIAKGVPSFQVRVRTFAFYKMWAWTIGILVLPWVTWWWVPEELQSHELHLTPRRATQLDAVGGAMVRSLTIRSFFMKRTVSGLIMKKAVNLSWVFYPVFIAVFLSPLNTNESKVIPEPGGYRILLYLGGCIMGICYSAAGVIVAIERPFVTEGSALEHLRAVFAFKAKDGQVMQCYAYIMLIPVGSLMGLFHVVMMLVRLSGCTLGNTRNIGACSAMQTMWLVIWLAWFIKGRIFVEKNGPMIRKNLWTALSLSLLGSCIILLIMFIRLVFYAESRGDHELFNSMYTGGDWDQSCQKS